MKTSYSIEEINAVLNGELIGTTSQKIEGPEQLQNAKNKHITFIGSMKYVKYWADSKACAAIINDNLTVEPGENRALIKVKNGDAVFERDSVIFDKIHYSFPLLSALSLTALNHNSTLNVLDFGGSLGSAYFQNKNLY